MENSVNICSRIVKVYRYSFAGGIICYRLELKDLMLGNAITLININKNEVETIISQTNAFLSVILPNLQALLDYAVELENIQQFEQKGFFHVESSNTIN